jgi:hypothetical protein
LAKADPNHPLLEHFRQRVVGGADWLGERPGRV